MNRRKILIIEDNSQNLYLATFLLEHHGHQVFTASTGPEGIALAAQAVPDVILLDIQLPGMDGHEVARALKSDPLLMGVPIIAVTSYAMASDRAKCRAAGMEGYIEKPIDPEIFAQYVEEIIAIHAKESNP